METNNLNRIPGGVLPVCHASQYDNGRRLKFFLYDGGDVYTLDGTETIVATLRKPDNTVVTRNVTNTSSNYVEVRLTEQMTAVAGNCVGEIVFYITQDGNTYRIGSCNFILEVEADPMDGGVDSKSDIHDLQTQVNDAVVVFLNDMLPVNVLTNWQIGGLRADNGHLLVATNRLRTSWMFQDLTKKLYRVKCDADYSALVFVYDDDLNYLGILQENGTTSAAANWRKDILVSGIGKVLKVVLKKDDDTDMDLTQINKIVFLGNMYPDPMTERDIQTVGESVASNTGYIFFRSVGAEVLERGAIDSSGSDVSSQYLTTSRRFNTFVAIEKNVTSIRSYIKLISESYNTYVYINFYDSDFTFISRSGGSKYYDFVATVPASAKYFRVSFTQITANDADNIADVLVSQGVVNNIGNSPQNKWFVLGDSISAGYFSMTEEEAAEKGYTLAYKPSDYGYPVYGVGSVYKSDLSHNYWGYANKWFLHRDLQPNARPGQGYFRKASNNENGIDVVKRIDFSDAGLITVAWGFNDWHYNQPRGNHDLIDPSVPYPTEGYDTTQLTTINHAIWFCLGELVRKAPLATIIVQTPMNGWLYGGDFASNWGIGYAMTNAGTLANIHDDIKYWADYYGLQVLDMTYNNSTVNRLNIKDALIDGSHPSDPAHMQLARHVATALHYL